MFVEGKGWVVPRVQPVLLSMSEMATISGFARSWADRKGYQFDNVRVGQMGESAVGKLILKQVGIPHKVDMLDYAYGDGGIDISVLGEHLQVKTTKSQSAPNRIARIRNGKLVPILSNIFIFVETVSITPALMGIRGYVHQKELYTYGIRHKVSPTIHEMRIDSQYLSPIDRLLKYLAQLKEVA